MMRASNRFFTDFVSLFVDYKDNVLMVRFMDCQDESKPKLICQIEHEGDPKAVFNINFEDKTVNANSKNEIKFSKRLKLKTFNTEGPIKDQVDG